MNFKFLLIFACFVFVISTVSFAEKKINQCDQAQVYQVLKDESLSKILYVKKLRPIYGPEGYLDFILNLNDLKDANKLDVGQNILLKKKCVDDVIVHNPQHEDSSKAESSVNLSKESIHEKKQKKYYVLLGLGSKTVDSKDSDAAGVKSASYTKNFNISYDFGFGYLLNSAWIFEANYQAYSNAINVPAGITSDSKSSNLIGYNLKLNYTFNQNESWTNSILLGIQRVQSSFLAVGLLTDVELLTLTQDFAQIGVYNLFLQSEKISWLFAFEYNPFLRSQLSDGTAKVSSAIKYKFLFSPIYQWNDSLSFNLTVSYLNTGFDYSYLSADSSIAQDGEYALKEVNTQLGLKYFF